MIELIERMQGGGHADDSVTLPYELRQKIRQRLRLDSGREAALVLPPRTTLADGDRLRAVDGTTVRVVAASEDVSVARSDDPLRLARACYHLGNRHVPLQVGPGWARYQPDHVLDEMVRGLGLAVTRETLPFEPERGAYHAKATPAAHGEHHHDHGHGHHHH
jgi:urease accessory protein